MLLFAAVSSLHPHNTSHLREPHSLEHPWYKPQTHIRAQVLPIDPASHCKVSSAAYQSLNVSSSQQVPITAPPQGQPSDLIKVAASQLAVLATKVTDDSFQLTVNKIQAIVNSSPQEAYVKYLRRLLLHNSDLVETNTVSNPVSQRLIQHELKNLASDPSRVSLFEQVLSDIDSEPLKFFTLESLFKKYNLSDFEKACLALNLNAKEAQSIVSSSVPGILTLIKQGQLSNSQLAYLLGHIGRSSSVSLLEKVLLFTVTIQTVPFSLEQSSSLEQSLQSLQKELSKMELSELLQQMSPETITPDRMLGDMLSALPQDKLDDAMGMLLSEMICPGSQSITGQAGQTTGLTSFNIPEAAAKGSQFGSVIRTLPTRPSWTTVFAYMNQHLPDPHMTEASLTQVLSALDDQTIDTLLEFDWSLNFKICLFVSLRQLNPQRGSFDLLRTNYLKPIVTDTSISNIKSSILYFHNVTKLELYCISMSTAIENLEFKKFLHLVFEEDIKTAPELIALGCVRFSPQSATVDDLFENLMVHLLDDSSPCYPLILQEIKNKQLLFKICEKLVATKTPSALNKTILTHLVQSDYITDFLESVSLVMAIEIGVACVKIGWIRGFEKFLETKKDVLGYIEVVIKFLGAQIDIKREARTTNVAAISLLLKSVDTSSKLTTDQMQHVVDLHTQVLQAFPRLINFGYGHDEAILANGDVNTFSLEVEQQMKVYYQRMYNHEIDIKEVINMLQRLKDSDVPSDQDLFACMIHSLLDEFKFFPEYPLNALAITSVLFGSMIHFGLVRGIALKVALNFIKESCHHQPESNMFKFSVQALYAFRQRLHEFPNYCNDLMLIESLKSQPQVYQIIVEAVNAPQVNNQLSSPVEEAPKTQSFRSVNPNSVISNDVPQEKRPLTEVSQKMMFVLNNLSEENVGSKVNDLKSVITPSVYKWLADYLVTQRAKTEPNNHGLYSDLLQRIGDDLLYEHVISVTIDEVNDLLNDSTAEKSQLKNLGSWLGRITLERNRPLRHRSIALKELLIEASDQSRLALVIPFVCKVIDASNSSEVFRLPNPWTLGIMKVLAELYEYAELKLNLRFEIEVLCNRLGVELNTIEPSSIIRKHDPNTLLEVGVASLSLDSKSLVIDQAPFMSLPQQHQHQQILQHQPLPQQQQQQKLQQHMVAPPVSAPVAPVQVSVDESSLQNLLGSTAFVTNPNMKRVFVSALAKSVQEILPPAVERAVSIAVTTARSLVLKDFATEADELKLRTASVNVVRQLSESLALATCRDPLKESIQSSVHAFASSQVVPLPLVELPQAISDNIDIACSLIQKAAMDKATQEIEEVLVSSVAVRRLHKERRPDQPFYSQYLSRYSVNLPEPLGLRPSGVTQQQFRVYETFGKNIMVSPSVSTPQSQHADTHVQSIATPIAAAVVPAAGSVPVTVSAPQVATAQSLPHVQIPAITQQMSPEQTFQYLQGCVDNLVRAITESSAGSLSEVPADSSIRALVAQVFAIAGKNLARDTLLLKTTQFVLNTLLSTSEFDLAVDVFVFLLEKLCAISATVRKDVVWWFEFASDDRKFNVKILLALFNAKLVSPSAFDGPLSRHVSPMSAEFTVSLLAGCLMSSNFVAFVSDFTSTLKNLKDIRAESDVADRFLRSIDELNVGLLNDLASDAGSAPESGSMAYIFLEWVRLLQNKSNNEDSEVAFITQIMTHGILDDFEKFTLFLRSSIEVSVDYFKESDPASDGFLAADSLSKLLVKFVAIQDGEEHQFRTLKTSFAILSLVFSEDHSSSRENFNERPYFRIMSSLLSEWNETKALRSEKDLCDKFYLSLAKFLNAFQPLAFPGFAFAWITLVSHRLFLPNILDSEQSGAEPEFVMLLLALLRFQAKHVKGKHIPEVFTVIYKGTLRIFLLLLHDFPELLVKYHYQLCCEIPPSFIQLRNIVLCAFPQSVSMPDPFTQGLKVDRLPEVSQDPEVGYNPANDLMFKKIIDGYLRIPSNMPLRTILNSLKQDSVEEAGIGYNTTQFNIKGINAVVLYVGMQAVADRPTNGHIFNPKSSHFSLLSGLMQEGGIEFQYQLIGAICNQLRYPNSHTQWFSHLILHFFGSQSLWNGKRVQVQHIITRVLLERVICNRPHPWGLLITFVELLKNAELAFFDLPFIKSDPEMEKLFNTLLRHFNAGTVNGNKEEVLA